MNLQQSVSATVGTVCCIWQISKKKKSTKRKRKYIYYNIIYYLLYIIYYNNKIYINIYKVYVFLFISFILSLVLSFFFLIFCKIDRVSYNRSVHKALTLAV